MTEQYLEDNVLVERARQGDKASFNQLVRKHEARAYKYAFRLTRNQEEAADVVADAFLRVYNALGNFKGQSAFTTWLYRILTNCFLDIKKKDKSRLTVSYEATFQGPDGETERQISDDADSPQVEAERTERESRFQEAVTMLPEYQRAMIVMYHAELLSYEDIAAALDLPIGTVKSRLNRARLSLRELLLKDEELFKV